VVKVRDLTGYSAVKLFPNSKYFNLCVKNIPQRHRQTDR